MEEGKENNNEENKKEGHMGKKNGEMKIKAKSTDGGEVRQKRLDLRGGGISDEKLGEYAWPLVQNIDP
jgi:hypothetical protein